MKIQSVFLIFLMVTLFFFVSLALRFGRDEINWLYESPKLCIVNPFWKKVDQFSKEVNLYLFIKDVMMCCDLVYHADGYLEAKDNISFLEAVIEAEKITGKRYKVYEWDGGKLVRINEMGLVLVLEK